MVNSMADPLNKITDYIRLPINQDFGVSDDKLASDLIASGTAVVSWYGLNTTNLKPIIAAIKQHGVSVAFFFAYTRVENGGAGGWINHFSGDTGNGGLADAIRDCDWLVATANTTGAMNLAWDDPGGGTVGMVPQSVRDYGNKDAASLPKGSIGRVYLQGTAAAVWGTYYPQGLTKAYNGVQDYGNPLQQTMDIIRNEGGKADGSSTTQPDDSGSTPSMEPSEELPCNSLNQVVAQVIGVDKWLH